MEYDTDEEQFCSRCKISIYDEQDNYLTDCTIIIADGQEGYANVTQLWCGDCLSIMIDALTDLGFKDHRHGGINFLEDSQCCGARSCSNDCPTPSEYGNYIVQ